MHIGARLYKIQMLENKAACKVFTNKISMEHIPCALCKCAEIDVNATPSDFSLLEFSEHIPAHV